MPTGRPSLTHSWGFTYMGLMLFMLIAGIGLAAAGLVWKTEVKREKEKQLLFVGEQYRRAINSYYENSPTGARQFPLMLEDLLKDTRFPVVRRHLRQIYMDPMTGGVEWGLIKEQGRIVGVYSLSKDKPLKSAGFSESNQDFANAASYDEWRFSHAPSAPLPDKAVVAPEPETPSPAAPVDTSASSSPPVPQVATAPVQPTDPGNTQGCNAQLSADMAVCRAQCPTGSSCYSNCARSALLRSAACQRGGVLPALVTQ